jgi:hypothetical protein
LAGRSTVASGAKDKGSVASRLAELRRSAERRIEVADPKKTEMPGGKMVEPPKGKKKARPGDMPSGDMLQQPPAKKDGKK